MLSLGVRGVRTLGKVMLVPDWGTGGWGGFGKGLLVDGERDRSGLLGVILRGESRELGPWDISYAEEDDEEDVDVDVDE